MKLKFYFTAVICSFMLITNAQDYYPMKLGNTWVYHLFDEEENIVGTDSMVCESAITTGDTTFYTFESYVDSISGGTDKSTQIFFDGITDPNEIYIKSILNLIFLKHQYVDKETYFNFLFSVTAHYIGDYTITLDTYQDCFYLEMSIGDSTGFIVAPDLGIIAAIEDSIKLRELRGRRLTRISEESLAICEGDSLLIYSEYQNEQGTYYDSVSDESGIDSIYITHLAVNPPVKTTIDTAICTGDSYFAGGADQNSSGTYYDTLSTLHGCDSVIVTNLTVNTCTSPVSEISNDNKTKIYPNPTSGIVYVEAENLKYIQVYNLIGNLVLETQHTSFDLSILPEGYYFVRCYTTSGEFTMCRILFRK